MPGSLLRIHWQASCCPHLGVQLTVFTRGVLNVTAGSKLGEDLDRPRNGASCCMPYLLRRV